MKTFIVLLICFVASSVVLCAPSPAIDACNDVASKSIDDSSAKAKGLFDDIFEFFNNLFGLNGTNRPEESSEEEQAGEEHAGEESAEEEEEQSCTEQTGKGSAGEEAEQEPAVEESTGEESTGEDGIGSA